MPPSDDTLPPQPERPPPPSIAAGASSTPGNGPTLDELRNRLIDMRQREETLKRRVRELQDLIRDTPDAGLRTEVDALRQRLEQRSRQLDAQAVELVRRRDELERAARVLEKRRNDADAQLEEARRLKADAELESETAQAIDAEQQRKAAERAEFIRQRERELEQRIVKARDEIVAQRAELAANREAFAQQTRGLDAQRKALAAERRELGLQQEEWSRRVAEFQRRHDELSRGAVEIEQSRARVAQDHQGVDEAHRGLQAQRDGLAAEQAALRARTETLQRDQAGVAQQRSELGRLADQLRQRRKSLDERHTALEAERGELADTAARLDRRQAALAQRDRELQAAAHELDRRSADLQRATDELAAAARQARQEEEQLAARRAALDELEEQLKLRDADSAQRAIALEVQSDELERREAVIEFAEEEMTALRAEREQELDQVRALLAQRSLDLERRERSSLAAPRHWWARASAIAAGVTAIAVWAWLQWDLPRYRAVCRLHLATAATPVERALREHVAVLVSGGGASSWLPDASAARDWELLCRAGRVEAAFETSPPVVELAVNAWRSGAAAKIVGTVASAYSAHTNDVAATPAVPTAYADVPARRAQVVSALDELTAARATAQQRLAALAPAAQRDELAARSTASRTALAAVSADLDAQRRALAELETNAPQHADVPAEAIDAALAAEPGFAVDREEFRAEAQHYRSELAVAVAPLAAQFQSLQQAVAAAARTIDEQRASLPPEPIASVLEDCAELAAEWQRSAARRATDCDPVAPEIERTDISGDIVALVQLQARGAELSDEQARANAGALEQLDALIARLNSGTGGATRELVVAAALRNLAAGLARVQNEFASAAASVGLAGNFRLDALDRRIRGLRVRLSDRRELVRIRLQEAADQQLVQQRAARLAQTRETLATLDSRREQLLNEMFAAMDDLRLLDEQVLERQRIETVLAQTAGEVSRLATQLAYLDRALAEARRSGPQPDRVTAVAPVVEDQVAGLHRERNALVVGLASFGGAWLLCVLMILKNPRRRQSLAASAQLAAAR
ncbi:MAG: hypothetical protein CHACPFDD_02526 [Phycisphaerae bacterium]|nr:hypothetical protein [Phycisphaerae bacterium]